MAETFQQRLQRFKNNSPIEFIETILNSIHNFYIPELQIAAENKQSNLHKTSIPALDG